MHPACGGVVERVCGVVVYVGDDAAFCGALADGVGQGDREVGLPEVDTDDVPVGVAARSSAEGRPRPPEGMAWTALGIYSRRWSGPCVMALDGAGLRPCRTAAERIDRVVSHSAFVIDDEWSSTCTIG